MWTFPWPFTIKRIMGIKYMFYVEILNFYLDVLQKSLRIFVRRVRVRRGMRVNKPIVEWTVKSHQCYLKLLIVKKIYGGLFKVSRHIKKIFGLFLVLVSAMICLTAIYCGYNLCVSLARKTNTYRIIGEVIFLTYLGIVLTFPGESTKKKVGIFKTVETF